MGFLRNAGMGVLLLIAAFIMLFWAEGRAVKTARALEEGAGLVVEVDAAKLDPSLDGKLVHISGTLAPQETPKDSTFGTSAQGATVLVRKVEMFQWEEEKYTEESNGNRITRYRHKKTWADKRIDSEKFAEPNGKRNPEMFFKSDSFVIGEGKVGAYALLGRDLRGLGTSTPIALNQADLDAAVKLMGTQKPIAIINNSLVQGLSAANPMVGDMRVTFTKVIVDKLSAVGQQSGGRLMPFKASNGNEVFLFEDGIIPASRMFQNAQDANAALTWGLRILGVVLMFIGSKLVFSMVTTFTNFIPVVGSIVGAGTTLASIAIAAVLASFAIAMGWIFYRPLLAVAVLAVGLAIAVAVAFMGKRNPQPQATSAQA